MVENPSDVQIRNSLMPSNRPDIYSLSLSELWSRQLELVTGHCHIAGVGHTVRAGHTAGAGHIAEAGHIEEAGHIVLILPLDYSHMVNANGDICPFFGIKVLLTIPIHTLFGHEFV